MTCRHEEWPVSTDGKQGSHSLGFNGTILEIANSPRVRNMLCLAWVAPGGRRCEPFNHRIFDIVNVDRLGRHLKWFHDLLACLAGL